MNRYLYKLGTQLGDIRKLLGWSQGELARRLGVSRPTILYIEKDPAKMSKTIALALVAVVIFEIGARLSYIEQADFNQWNDAGRREAFLRDLTKYGGLNGELIKQLIFDSPDSVGFPLLSTFNSLIVRPAQSMQKHDINGEVVREIAYSSIAALQSRLSDHFFVNTLNLVECIRLIEEDDEIINAIIDEES
jgi:DNA-binding XRE family transcriptional regulator